MTDLRESVARAMWKDASERGADGFDSALDYQWHETDEDTRQTFLDDASAALRAVADAGFVIVPREPTEAMLAAGALAIDRAAFDSNWKGHPEDQRSRQDSAYDDARSALGAALKEMGAG